MTEIMCPRCKMKCEKDSEWFTVLDNGTIRCNRCNEQFGNVCEHNEMQETEKTHKVKVCNECGYNECFGELQKKVIE